jgi:hypothetical protein
MAKRQINTGNTPNDKSGDSLRTAFTKINENFTELYNSTGGLDLLNVASHIVPATDITYDLGSTTKRFRHLYVGSGSIYIGDARLSLEGGKLKSSVGFKLTDSQIDDVLPLQTGNAGKFLTTDGNNVLSWGAAAGGGGTFDGSAAALTLTGKIPYAQPVLVAPPVTFTRPNNSTNTVDVIDTGITFKRVNNGALFNSAAGETSWNSNQSPLGTEWNFDGWGDLADVKTRTYTTFNNAIQDWGAANIHHREFVMHDTINDKYYTFKFSWWQANGGNGANQSMDEKSGFTYVRQLINTDPTVVFVHPAGDANTNQDDIGPGLSITRGTNGGGIYNAQEDSEWDPDTTPYGTLWNDEGWDDFADITTRTWKPFFTAVHGRLGNELVGRKLLMKDTGNNKYYLIKFTEWGENNGGSFAYTRREVNPTGTKLGITFADGTKQLTANTLGYLKIVGDNAIYNATQPGHGAEIRSEVENNYSFNTYYWTGDANWVTTGDQGLVEFNIAEIWQQDFARFLSNLDRWLTVTVRINDGPAQTITDWWSEGFVTKEPPATDPTLVTNLRFDTVFRSRMYMGGEENVGFYLDKQNESFKVDSRNIYLTAGESENFNGSIYASGWGTVELRSNNPNNSVNIVADGDNTAKTWVFNANGKLQLPAGGDIVTSDGTTSVLGGGSTGSIRFDGTWIKNVDTGNIFISPQDGNTFLDLPSDTQASSSTVRLGNTDATGSVRIQAGDAGKYWEFKHNGITKFPSNTIKTSSSLVIQALTGVPTGSVTKLGGNQGWGAGSVGNNLATTGGSGTGLTVNVIDSGSAYSGISINTPGSGYVDGDVITVTNGGMSDSFTIRVPSSTWSFDADGAITTNDAFTVKTPSSTFIPSTWNGGGGWNQGYYSNVATTGGTGTGMTVNVGAGGGGYINISAISISNPGSGYTAGDVITINNENNIPGSFTLVAVPNTWAFNTDGSITFPTQTTRDYANRTSYTTGPTLQLKDNGTDATAVITGPAATEANQTAKRLVIQGQPGWRDTSTQPIGAEGGDVYIWAGHGGEGSDQTGDGGDVKLRGGAGGQNGGYVRVEAGEAKSYNGVGGFLDLNAGDALSGYVGGANAQGGPVQIRGGRGYGQGGAVNIHTATADIWDHQWTFGVDGNLTLPANGKIGVPNNAGGTGGYIKFYGAGGEGGDDNTSATSGDVDIVAGVDGGYDNDNTYGNFNIGNIRLKTKAFTGQPEKVWTFGWDGNLRLAGTIKSPYTVTPAGHQFTIATGAGGAPTNIGASGVTLDNTANTALIQVGWTAEFADYGPIAVDAISSNNDGTTYFGMNSGTGFSATLPVIFTSPDFVAAVLAPLTLSADTKDWTFAPNGALTLPNAAVIGQASDIEITAAQTAYTTAIASWESTRINDYLYSVNNVPGLSLAGWPFAGWSNVDGTTATAYLAIVNDARARQNSPSSPPQTLLFTPSLSAQMYIEIRALLQAVINTYATWQALLTSVKITSGSESVTLMSNGKLIVPGIVQTDPEENLVIRTRYAVTTSPPSSGTYSNVDFTFGTNGHLNIPIGIASDTGNLSITPQSAVSSKFFNFFVDSYAGTFIRSTLAMPIAENNKTVDAQFYHANGTVGYLWNQGTDTNVTSLNNAFNIFANGTDIKLTAEDSSSNLFTWKFAKDGNLTVPGSIIGTVTQDVFNTTSTTVNAFGAATTLNIGASGGTTTIAGNLTVNGTTTTINSTTISVDDKNIELGSVATPTNTTADGGGITLKGDTDKTIIWDSANSNWTSSEHWNIASGKSYKINNVAVLSASAVLASATGVTVGGTGTTTIALGTNTTATNTVTVGGAIDGNTLKVAGTTTGTINLTTDVTSGTVNIFTSATGTITIGTAGSGIVGFAKTATTSSTASSLGYLGLPQSATNTSATLAIGDAGKHIYVNTASQTMTIPANGTVAYPIGTTLTFIAGPSATTVSIAITTDTMYLAGTGTTGTRTLAAHGMATAVKVAATTWYINGTGLT